MPPTAPTPSPRDLVLFDGVCGLCDRTVRFLLRRDRHGHLLFAPLQGETAATALARHGISEEVRSLVFLTGWGSPEEAAHVRSAGALRALAALGGFWRFLAAFLRLVPRTLRDAAYDFIARRRYRWFGRFDRCRLPPANERERFLP